jgi:hypothetical protein
MWMIQGSWHHALTRMHESLQLDDCLFNGLLGAGEVVDEHCDYMRGINMGMTMRNNKAMGDNLQDWFLRKGESPLPDLTTKAGKGHYEAELFYNRLVPDDVYEEGFDGDYEVHID